MKKNVEITIRVSLLSIMIILGLIALVPQSLDLMDFIFEDYKAKMEEHKQKIISWQISLPSFDNISPKRGDVKNYISSLENVKRVYCIGAIQKTRYSKKFKSNGIPPASLRIKFQAVIQKGANVSLKTGILIVSPKLITEGYGHWLWPSYRTVFERWVYQENPSMVNRETDIGDTDTPNILDYIRVKNCL